MLIATADGYAPDWIRRWGRMRTSTYSNPVAGSGLELQLAEDVPIEGRFLDADGQPLRHASVKVTALMVPKDRNLDAHLEQWRTTGPLIDPNYERRTQSPHLIAGLTVEAQTDADGRFTLTGLGRDRLVQLTVSAPEVATTHLTVMTRDAPGVPAGGLAGDPSETWAVIHGARFTQPLPRGWTITGRVHDRDSQEPIAGMWVGMQAETPATDPEQSAPSRITDLEGRFAITGLSTTLLDRDEERRRVVAMSLPGMPYRTASAIAERDSEVVIETSRGIAYRLTLLDERGNPVEAEVTSVDVQPNPHVGRSLFESRWPVSRADRLPDGTYEGYLLPGPGAVLVETADRRHRPAHVDPEVFFAADRAVDSPEPGHLDYGDQDKLITSHRWLNQHDYAAIVLVNPAPDSEPLELTATVFEDRPRQVTLLGPDGNPVDGVQTQGMTFHPWDHEPSLRSASFVLRGLHPDRARKITFIEKERGLVGELLARGDDDAPYTVRMRPQP